MERRGRVPVAMDTARPADPAGPRPDRRLPSPPPLVVLAWTLLIAGVDSVNGCAFHCSTSPCGPDVRVIPYNLSSPDLVFVINGNCLQKPPRGLPSEGLHGLSCSWIYFDKDGSDLASTTAQLAGNGGPALAVDARARNITSVLPGA